MGFFEFMQITAFGYALFELLMSITPFWFAVGAGVLVGWAWKPKWANLDCVGDWFTSTMTSSLFPSFSGISFPPEFGSVQNLTSVNFQLPSLVSWTFEKEIPDFTPASRSSQPNTVKSYVLNEKDLHQLHQLLEEDGGPGWVKVMERSTSNTNFLAHRRNNESGPLMYRTITVHEDATPEVVRDFFWDDDFRANWDEMHLHSDLLEECTKTGAMLVHWIRKWPLFCSDREYTIARRIWQLGDSYYCVCKGVPCPYLIRREKTKQVDEFYSSWRIRPAKSARDGRLTASEVTLFHYEDMGMPRGIAKFGVENGMWGTVKRIDPGLRAYQKYRASDPPLSRYILLGHINTKLSVHTFGLRENRSCSSSEVETKCPSDKPVPDRISKLVVFCGALALACSFDRRFLNKVLLYGVARRFVGIGGAAAM